MVKKCKKGLKLYEVTSTQKMRVRKVCAKSHYGAKMKVQKSSGGNLITTFMTSKKIKW